MVGSDQRLHRRSASGGIGPGVRTGGSGWGRTHLGKSFVLLEGPAQRHRLGEMNSLDPSLGWGGCNFFLSEGVKVLLLVS